MNAKKTQARDIEVGPRVEAAMLELAERSKEYAERSARAEEQATIALQTIAAAREDLKAITLDLRAMAEEIRGLGRRTDGGLDALETRAARPSSPPSC